MIVANIIFAVSIFGTLLSIYYPILIAHKMISDLKAENITLHERIDRIEKIAMEDEE